MSEDFELENLPEEEEYTPPKSSDESRVISYNISNTVQVLISKIDNDEIDLKPEFQRDFVWDKKRASFFIDSLIIGVPIPSIFLGKRKNEESFFVIDGQQRLKSIYSFVKNEYQISGRTQKFKLSGLDGKKWNDTTFEDLEQIDKRKFFNSVINTTIIENIEDDPVLINDIFHRLNTGGMPLNDQEIRNCIYRGPFNQYLKTLNENENWRRLLGKMSPNKRLRDIELILRYIALFNNFSEYKEPMRNFLGNYMNDYHDGISNADEISYLFSETCRIIYSEIGKDAFRLKRYFNRAVCDAILYGISKNIQNSSLTNNLVEAHRKLLSDKGFLTYISESTALEINISGRLDLACRYFEK